MLETCLIALMVTYKHYSLFRFCENNELQVKYFECKYAHAFRKRFLPFDENS